MRRRTLFLATVSSVLVGCAALGEVLTSPSHRPAGAPPDDLQLVPVDIPSGPGEHLSGWLAAARPGSATVLRLHGVRASRLQMLCRARFLRDAGYGVLLVDLPGHGESTGERISYGVREAQGVAAALDFLRDRAPGAGVGAIGVSLGAAALVLARPNRLPDAVVLESMFPTFDDAVRDRLGVYLGPGGEYFAPLLVRELGLRLGVSPTQLRPIDRISALGCPVFIMSGSADRLTTRAETERIYAAAPNPKQLWIVDGAGHQDLHAYAATDYETRVKAFFAAHLVH